MTTRPPYGLAQVYPPSDGPDESTIDIIAIHGLDTSAPGTWEYKSRDGDGSDVFNWLSDPNMLPGSVPQACILTYNWPSNIYKDAVDLTLRELACGLLLDIRAWREQKSRSSRRALIFIASCFGGLVLVKAFTLASATGNQYAFLRHVTAGIVFLGTPFKGSAATRKAQWLAAYGGVMGERTSEALVKDLDKSSGVLDDVVESFLQSVRLEDYHLPMHCFFETKETNLTKKILPDSLAKYIPVKVTIVDEASACLSGVDGTYLDCNHSMMNKFAPETQNFQRVRSVMNRLVHNAEDVIAKRADTSDLTVQQSLTSRRNRSQSPPHPSMSIPFNQDASFVNRDALLDQLWERCTVPASRTALVGLGGVGKSQLAIEFAYRIRDERPDTWLLWVHASNATRFRQSFEDIAEKARISGRHDPMVNIYKIVYGWLLDDRRKWCLILDSLDDANYLYNHTAENPRQNSNNIDRSLRDYLPCSSNGSILITSRNRAAALTLVADTAIIDVGQMTSEEALTLMTSKLKPSVPKELDEVADLVEELEYMPLAIVQAAAYISLRDPLCSVQQYLDMFRQSERGKRRLLKFDGADIRRDREATTSILVTWQISFEHISKARPSAADLLSLMSFFDGHGIPSALLQNPGMRKASKRYDKVNETNDDMDNSTDSDTGNDTESESQFSKVEEFDDDIQMLRCYSFISIDTDKTLFKLHSLVQLATRTWLQGQGKHEEFRQLSANHLYQAFPSPEFENWGVCRALLPHVKAMIQQKPKPQDLLSVYDWNTTLSRAGTFSMKISDTTEALIIEKSLAELLKPKAGHITLYTIEHLRLKHGIKLYQGHVQEAEFLGVLTLDMVKQHYGERHPLTLKVMTEVAIIWCHQGRFQEAEKLLAKAVETCNRELGEENPRTLETVRFLGSTYSLQGRHQEAEALQERVIEAEKRIFGEGHPQTILTMDSLALTYCVNSQYQKAETLEKRALENAKRVFGEEHIETVRITQHLGEFYHCQSRYQEAAMLFRQTLEITRRLYGENRPFLSHIMGCLASSLQAQIEHPISTELMLEWVRLKIQIYDLTRSSHKEKFNQFVIGIAKTR